MSMVLAVIPARGGSKGVPRKNIRLLCGKPLLAHAIECGRACPEVDHVIVSTEDTEIADIARDYGADVPFMRPAPLAEDTAPMLPVLQHAVEQAEVRYGQRLELLVLLDPTGPLRIPDDISRCVELARGGNCDAVISGNRAHRSPYFNMVAPDGDYVKLAAASATGVGRRQDSPPVYDLNTVVWVYSRRALMQEQARIPKKSRIYLVPPERALDLDSELDFEILEAIIRRGERQLQPV